MNISMAHPMLSIKQKVHAICDPLFVHSFIQYFLYERYYYDGKYLLLAQNADFENEVVNLHLLPSLEEIHINQSRYLYLSSMLPMPEFSNNDNKYLQNILIGQKYNISNRLLIISQNINFVEVFSYGMETSQKKGVIENYLNDLSILENFCHYFREASRDLIKEVEDHKLIFDATTDPRLFKDLSTKKKESYKEFFNDIKLKKYTLVGKNGTCEVSAREFEYLLWLATNRSTKQISRILSLSPRTLEDYFANLKRKLGCTSRFELIEIYSKNPIIDAFSDLIK